MSRLPTIPYPGGKARLAPTLVSLMPRSGRRYLEPFAGRGNVFWAAASIPLLFQLWILNDIRTAPFFEAVRAIGSTVEVPERSREEFDRQREAFKAGSPTADVLEPYLTFGGGGYGNGMGGTGRVSTAGYARALRACHDLMVATDVEVTSKDWTQIPWPDYDPNDFVYFDPPYIGANVRPYKSGDLNHEDLARFLRDAPFRWMLSEYKHDLYLRELGPPFWTKEVQLRAPSYRLANGGKERRIECVWKNY